MIFIPLFLHCRRLRAALKRRSASGVLRHAFLDAGKSGG